MSTEKNNNTVNEKEVKVMENKTKSGINKKALIGGGIAAALVAGAIALFAKGKKANAEVEDDDDDYFYDDDVEAEDVE